MDFRQLMSMRTLTLGKCGNRNPKLKPEHCISRPICGSIFYNNPIACRAFFDIMITEQIKRRRSLSNKRGFTLIEIMLVIGLMVLLVGLVVTNVDNLFGTNQAELVRFKVKESFKTPLTSYRIHMGSFPSTQQGLKALAVRPEGDGGRWRGPYIEGEENLKDPWGRDLQYRYPGTHNTSSYDLYSLGPDGTESGDDITDW